VSEHIPYVDALFRQEADQSASRRREVFATAFNAIWGCAKVTLGDVTLRAVVKRVFYLASAPYPMFATLAVSSTGISSEGLDAWQGTWEGEGFEEGLRFVLLELLRMLGTLTADILTPSLHEALSEVISSPVDGLKQGE
jgi:hypothetical protein